MLYGGDDELLEKLHGFDFIQKAAIHAVRGEDFFDFFQGGGVQLGLHVAVHQLIVTFFDVDIQLMQVVTDSSSGTDGRIQGFRMAILEGMVFGKEFSAVSHFVDEIQRNGIIIDFKVSEIAFDVANNFKVLDQFS